MSKGVDVPSEYTVHSDLSGSLDFDLDNIRIRELPTITLNTTSTIDVEHLPRIDVGLEVAMKPTRVHLPMNYKLGFAAFGMELFSWSMCGEGMVIIEDYVPHAREACS